MNDYQNSTGGTSYTFSTESSQTPQKPTATSKTGVFFATPFEKRHLEVKVKSGFSTIEQKSELTELTLVMNASFSGSGSKLTRGQKIIVRADSYSQPWARAVYTYNGEQFVIVPEDYVLGYV